MESKEFCDGSSRLAVKIMHVDSIYMAIAIVAAYVSYFQIELMFQFGLYISVEGELIHILHIHAGHAKSLGNH